MFNTPGIIKFFWHKDNVETKYPNIYDIPLMDINKKIFKLNPETDNNFLLVHIRDLTSDKALISRIQ